MDWEVVQVRPLLFANALSACLGLCIILSLRECSSI